MLTDITERKQMEEALREAYEKLQVQSDELRFQSEELQEANKALCRSENKFRTLAENSPDLIARFDRQNCCLYANPAIAKFRDSYLDEFVGKISSELRIDPEMARFSERQREKVFTAGKNKIMEFHYTLPNGKEYYFNTQIVPEFANNKVDSVLTISRDITDIIKAEIRLKEALDNLEKKVKERTAELEAAYISLKESETSLAEAQRMAHIGNWDWNLVNGEVYCSDELYRIFKYTPQELTQYFDHTYSLVHSEDRDYVNNAIKKGLKGEPFSIDHRIILTNGEERTVHAQIEVVFDEKNTPARMRGTVQDITESIKAEEKIRNLANIVESSDDAIGTISLEGFITCWNKGAEQVYGYSAEEVLGKPISILAPSHLAEETKKLGERIKKGEKIRRFATSRLRRDGKKIVVAITLSPVFDIRGKLTSISFISRDITERKKVEEKLRESEEKYRNIVETANEGIYLMNDDARVTYVNEKIVELSGYSQEEIVGRPIWDFISKESKP